MLETQSATAPNRWQGEADCLVGPFSSRTVAEYFATHVVNVGDSGVSAKEVLVKGDSWFVEVEAYEARGGPSARLKSRST